MVAGGDNAGGDFSRFGVGREGKCLVSYIFRVTVHGEFPATSGGLCGVVLGERAVFATGGR